MNHRDDYVISHRLTKVIIDMLRRAVKRLMPTLLVAIGDLRSRGSPQIWYRGDEIVIAN